MTPASLFSNESLWKRRPPLCHLDRSAAKWRDLCVDALSWECFSRARPGNICLPILLALVSLTLSAQTQPAATIPNGRQITPVGDWITVAPFPFALAMRPDGQQLIAPSLGFPFALNVIDRPATADRNVVQIPRGFRSVPGVEFYAGVAYSPSGKLLYVATGDTGAVDVMSTADWKKIARISLNGASQSHIYKESFAAALTLSKNGRSLYVVDQANFRVVVIDTATRTRMASLKTGVNPIALCLSPDNKRLYVANSGLFEYNTIPGADNADRLHSGLHFPPFGYPSAAAREGTSIEGRQIAGLGDANSVRGSSLWTYDLGGSPACSLAAVGDVDYAREPCSRRRRTFRGGGEWQCGLRCPGTRRRHRYHQRRWAQPAGANSTQPIYRTSIPGS